MTRASSFTDTSGGARRDPSGLFLEGRALARLAFRRPRRWVVSVHGALSSSTVVVAVDVGKRSFAVSVSTADRQRLLGPVDCAMTRPGLDRLVEQVRTVLPADGVSV